MATKTYPTLETISDASPAYIVHYPHDGTLYVVGFDTFMDLLDVVTSHRDEYGDPLGHVVINRIVDFVEDALDTLDDEVPADCNCELCQSFPAASLPRPTQRLEWVVTFMLPPLAWLLWRALR